jgi:hypothetical protein
MRGIYDNGVDIIEYCSNCKQSMENNVVDDIMTAGRLLWLKRNVDPYSCWTWDGMRLLCSECQDQTIT